MPRFQQNSRPSDRHGFWNWTAGLLAVYGAAVLVLVGLMMRYPAVSLGCPKRRRPNFRRHEPVARDRAGAARAARQPDPDGQGLLDHGLSSEAPCVRG